MKEAIHPKYGETKVVCACGNTFMSGSVKTNTIDVCSKCHPFFTGQQRNMVKRGRIENSTNVIKQKRNNCCSRAGALLCLYLNSLIALIRRKTMERKPNVGGQAVIEGVMMRGAAGNIAVAVRQPNGEIIIDKMASGSIADNIRFLRSLFCVVRCRSL